MFYVVGRCIQHTQEGMMWDFSGVFDTEEAAVATCGDHRRMFVMETEINDDLGRVVRQAKSPEYNYWYPAIETKAEGHKRLHGE